MYTTCSCFQGRLGLRDPVIFFLSLDPLEQSEARKDRIVLIRSRKQKQLVKYHNVGHLVPFHQSRVCTLPTRVLILVSLCLGSSHAQTIILFISHSCLHYSRHDPKDITETTQRCPRQCTIQRRRARRVGSMDSEQVRVYWQPTTTTTTNLLCRHYSLEVTQHPLRARMCGFGDKVITCRSQCTLSLC